MRGRHKGFIYCGPLYSPVNLWFDLEKIATEFIFVANVSWTPPTPQKKSGRKSKWGKIANLHKTKMAAFCESPILNIAVNMYIIIIKL